MAKKKSSSDLLLSKGSPLSTPSYKKITGMLSEVLSERQLITECMDALLSEDHYDWHKCYEYPPKKLTAVLLVCFGVPEKIPPKDCDLAVWDSQRPGNISRGTAFGVMLAQLHDLECYARYGLHMYELLKRGNQGNEKAFLKALEVDGAVANCKVFAKRLNRARIRKEDPFLKDFAKKVSSSNNRHALHRKLMRHTLRMLESSDSLSRFSNKELADLFRELDIGSATADQSDSIKTLVANWRKARQEL